MRRRSLLFCALLLFALPGLAAAALAPGASGQLVAWGRNNTGQLDVPDGLAGVTAIAGGTWHSLALLSGDTVASWGMNAFGQADVPDGLAGVTAVAAGGLHSLALRADGTVVGWGYNASGQATGGDGLTGVRAIAAGFFHNLALLNDGTVVAWGDNLFGQLNVPQGLTGVTAIAAGYHHNLALLNDGTVVAWGRNFEGQVNIPPGLTGVTAVAGGGGHSLALLGDGTVVAWGQNDFGQSGVPAGLTGVTAIAGGGFHSLALLSDRSVVGWGDDAFGQISGGAGVAGVCALAGGGFHSLALIGGAPPAAAPDTYAIPRATTLSVAAPGVLANDTDADGDPLTALLETPPAGGTLDLRPDGSFTYTPRVGFSGTDRFTYRPFDGMDAGDPAEVEIQVSGDFPAATRGARVAGTGAVNGGGSFTVSARVMGDGSTRGSLVFSGAGGRFASAAIHSVTVRGRHARVFGTARLPGRGTVYFAADLEDVAEPGAGRDRFGLETSAGPNVPPAPITRGNVNVER